MALVLGFEFTGAGIPYTLTLGDNFLLAESIFSRSTDTYCLYTTTSSHDILIEGKLMGVNGAFLGDSGADTGIRLNISSSGYVGATSGTAVSISGSGALINNQGLVAGNTGFFFGATVGTGSALNNSGRIISEATAIEHYYQNAETLTINNSGLIKSYDSYALYTSNSTGKAIINNSGTIVGDVYFGFGADVYEGNGGRVLGNASGLGTVFGQAGTDVLRGGATLDRLNGGQGADFLTGRGGRDILTGGTEVDRFSYFSVTDLGDTITDFTTADFFQFRSMAFGSATPGTCSVANFCSSLSGLAEDASDRFIYETDRDILWFDSNGSGAGGRYMVTDFAYDVALTRFDIIIF